MGDHRTDLLRLSHVWANIFTSVLHWAAVNDISVFGPMNNANPEFERLVSTIKYLFEESMEPHLLDDRLDQQWQTETVSHQSYRAVLCSQNNKPIGLLEHWTTESGDTRLELLLHKDLTQPLHPAPVFDEAVSITETLISKLSETAPLNHEGNGPTVELWSRPTSTPVERVIENLKSQLTRHLFQMRCETEISTLDFVDQSVPFTPDDRETLIEINNLAFADHPDQGNMTVERFERIASEPWFEPDGIRLWKVEDRIAAFCWTKIHDKPPLGEIYVIGVDPTFQGRGIGTLVTTSGIHWLAHKQQRAVMLYVEADNIAAVKVYERLGFKTVRVDKAWQLSLQKKD